MQSLDALRQLTVLDRERIEHVIRCVLDLRVQSNFSEMSKFCADNVVLEVVGDPRRFIYAGKYCGRDAVLDCVRRMGVEIDYLDYELLDLLIDHDKALLRRRVFVRHRGTGITIPHEIWDRLRFEDGMVVEISKFIDVDAYNRLQGGS